MRTLITLAAFLLTVQAYTQPVHIPDPNLRAAIHEQLQRPEHRPIDQAAMLELIDLPAIGRGITSLVGLEYAKNLVVLEGHQNPISDLSPLANLDRLHRLFMSRCEISDLRPLATLPRLEYVDLRYNRIVDLSPIAEWPQILGLGLSRNKIKDVTPLANLMSLQSLDVTWNNIKDHSPLDGLAIADLRYDQICERPSFSVRDRIQNRNYPSIISRWSSIVSPPIDNRPELSGVENVAKHDLWFSGPMFGLRFEYSPEDITVLGRLDEAIRRRQEFLAINPNMVFLIYVRMRNGTHGYIPEDSPHWVRDGQGNIVDGVMMDFTHPYIQDRIVKQAIAVSKCGLYDGIMFDWWNEHGPVLTTPDAYRGNEVEQRTRDSILQRIRAATRPDFLIMGNTNYRIIPRTGPHINGGFMEISVPADRTGINLENALARLEQSVIWLDQNLREPRISGLEGRTISTESPSSPTNRRWMRAITTLSLTHSDGYTVFSQPYKWTHNWYDFWDADLGRPVGEKGQLYQGIDGLYIREFTNGWAVYNHSGAPRVITLPEETKGVASQLGGFSHTLANLDGEMYLRATPKNPADVNGDGVVNILDLTLVAQGFGSNAAGSDVNGDGVVNVFDLVMVAAEF